ncbi:MAG: tRNA (guanosine(46)-N7)-methyltransferase TrmB [Lachnospiraceae bacterium]|jgi:tRNA (guanine-N7-)-methyltransferase|nr:tRNA (guanosine(46)-N7)-methyltransferase TrmB [Lachnospiraceae bacterium]
MRLRNIRGSREVIAANEYVVHEAETKRGQWNSVFGNGNPIQIEIGMGKGQFLTELARQNPEINYVGIEKYSSVLIRAIEKRSQEDLPNLLFVRMDAEHIHEVFGEEEVERIYLNFSDPWPKDRHAKRRLTSKEFLARYEKCLKRDGDIQFKTDNKELFEFSLEQAAEAGWETREVTYDLHHSAYLEGNVMTEYEERFSAQGNPICRMVLVNHFAKAAYDNNRGKDGREE